MARRGRRQVLQLDDVSSSHPARPRGFEPLHSENKKRELTSSSLLNLVVYSSDPSSDEDEVSNEAGDDSSVPPERNGHSNKDLEIPLPAEIQPHKISEVPEPFRAPQLPQDSEPPTRQSMQDIPLPGPCASSHGDMGSSIDSEVANFLAEIESISAETVQNEKPETEHTTAADSSQSVEPDLGFIPRPDASLSLTTEESEESSSTPAIEDKRSKPTSSSSAYQSMFVKGASEFVKKEAEEDKKKNGAEMEDELPEEPVSQWQMVQDDATQYYYYWNMVTNEVTWEIPPDYTQFLLLYKEYEERIASIPKDKLLRMKEMKEKKKQGTTVGREASPVPSSSQSKKEKKHKKEKHRKEASEPVSSDPHHEIGPQLLPFPPESSNTNSNAQPSMDQSEAETVVEGKTVHSPKPHRKESKEVIFPETLDSAVDSTSMSVPEDVEAIFDAALSAVTESTADSHKTPAAVNTSVSSVDTSSPSPSIDITMTVASAESTIPSSSVDSTKTGSPSEKESVTITSASASNSAVVSSSSVISTVSGCEKDGRITSVESEEPAVSHSGVNDSAAPEEEDDDFDMDFDDIDDVDRALEKALEKKLEKKKAELEKLEKSQPESQMVPDAGMLPSSLSEYPSQSEASEHLVSKLAQSSSSAEPESTVSSSVKMATELIPPSTSASRSLTTSPLSSSVSGDKDSLEVKEPSKPKRSAAESSTEDDDLENQKPAVKKARLVAYDAPETDDESMDTSDEVNTTPAKSVKSQSDPDYDAHALPTHSQEPVDNQNEMKEMADTALAKLAFLEVTSEGMSALQIGLIALQTRLSDWQNGGLNGDYFFQRLKEAQDLLKHYESTAVPTGWSCEWDSNFRRYFYVSASTGEAQWDYPDVSTHDSLTKNEDRKTRKTKGTKKKRTTVIGPKPLGTSGLEASSTGETETSHQDVPEDLDGTAMTEEELGHGEVLQHQANEENADNQPSTSTSMPESENGMQSALQALFPGEPLPPGTELLLGLPPPPPPPLPADEMPSTTDDAYVCGEDSSDDGGDKDDDRTEVKTQEETETPHYDPDIDGEEMVEEEEEEVTLDKREEGEEADTGVTAEDPAVISRPPQLRFPAMSGQLTGLETSSTTVSALPVLSGAPVLNSASAPLQPDSASNVLGAPPSVSTNSSMPGSPKSEDWQRSVSSPSMVHEASSSSTTDHQKHEKHKKKKKEKLGSHMISLKKKGVSSLVQKWQKVKKEAEKEERASEQRQLAIRQQLEEWKKENS